MQDILIPCTVFSVQNCEGLMLIPHIGCDQQEVQISENYHIYQAFQGSSIE